jgi:hypothetical protein
MSMTLKSIVPVASAALVAAMGAVHGREYTPAAPGQIELVVNGNHLRAPRLESGSISWQKEHLAVPKISCKDSSATSRRLCTPEYAYVLTGVRLDQSAGRCVVTITSAPSEPTYSTLGQVIDASRQQREVIVTNCAPLIHIHLP